MFGSIFGRAKIDTVREFVSSSTYRLGFPEKVGVEGSESRVWAEKMKGGMPKVGESQLGMRREEMSVTNDQNLETLRYPHSFNPRCHEILELVSMLEGSSSLSSQSSKQAKAFTDNNTEQTQMA